MTSHIASLYQIMYQMKKPFLAQAGTLALTEGYLILQNEE